MWLKLLLGFFFSPIDFHHICRFYTCTSTILLCSD